MVLCDERCARPIGVFDSGVGGLTVLAQLQKTLPGEDTIFLGDNAYGPYGDRDEADIRQRSLEIAGRLMHMGIKALLVACNTATSAAVQVLRAQLPVPVIGMEPAVLPALEEAGAGQVAVLATAATVRQQKFKALVQRTGREADIIPIGCPGLVELIEGERGEAQIVEYLLHHAPDRARQAAAVVLGCTHYILIRPAVAAAFPGAKVVDGNEGAVRHLKEVLEEAGLRNPRAAGGQTRLITTGDEGIYLPLFDRMLERARPFAL